MKTLILVGWGRRLKGQDHRLWVTGPQVQSPPGHGIPDTASSSPKHDFHTPENKNLMDTPNHADSSYCTLIIRMVCDLQKYIELDTAKYMHT